MDTDAYLYEYTLMERAWRAMLYLDLAIRNTEPAKTHWLYESWLEWQGQLSLAL